MTIRDDAGAAARPRKSDLAYLVTGILLIALGDNGGMEALGLRVVPEFVDGVTTGRVVLEDDTGRRLVIDVQDPEPDA